MELFAPSVEISGIMQQIESISGIVLNDQNAHLLEHRIKSILKSAKVDSVQDLHYHLCIKKDPKITSHVIEAITTNETFWFRDKALWTMMEELLFPEYVRRLRTKETNEIQIWSAACSSGQEPYSIAMSIDLYLKKQGIEDIQLSQFKILATDISDHVLQLAAKAKYDGVSVSRGLEDAVRDRYFYPEGKGWHLKDEIKSAVRFQKFNLMDGLYAYDQFDLIFCRNVLIYFSEANKKRVYTDLGRSLRKNGILLIGSSELIEEDQRQFSRQQHATCVYFKKYD